VVATDTTPARRVIALSLHERRERRRSRRPAAREADATAASRGFDLSEAYDAHGPALLGFAVNSLRDRGLAEDCVQETFLRAWRNRARYDAARATLRTWLFAIERNVIVDVHRSMSRMPRLADPAALDDLAMSTDELERLRVAEAVARLSTPHREVIVAVHLRGDTYAELSERTGVPVPTLRTRAFYALRALREHLDDQEDPS